MPGRPHIAPHTAVTAQAKQGGMGLLASHRLRALRRQVAIAAVVIVFVLFGATQYVMHRSLHASHPSVAASPGLALLFSTFNPPDESKHAGTMQKAPIAKRAHKRFVYRADAAGHEKEEDKWTYIDGEEEDDHRDGNLYDDGEEGGGEEAAEHQGMLAAAADFFLGGGGGEDTEDDDYAAEFSDDESGENVEEEDDDDDDDGEEGATHGASAAKRAQRRRKGPGKILRRKRSSGGKRKQRRRVSTRASAAAASSAGAGGDDAAASGDVQVDDDDDDAKGGAGAGGGDDGSGGDGGGGGDAGTLLPQRAHRDDDPFGGFREGAPHKRFVYRGPKEGVYLGDEGSDGAGKDKGELDLRAYKQVDVRGEKWRPRLTNECKRFGMTGKACRGDERLLFSGDLAYPAFFLPMPLTYDKEDAQWWRECIDYGGQIIRRSRQCPRDVCPEGIDHDKVVAFHTERHLFGRLNLVANATFRRSHVCGWSTDYKLDTEVDFAPAARDRTMKKGINLLAPQSWSFQHFVNDVLPKFIQFWELLHDDEEVQIVIERGRDMAMVNRILGRLGLDLKRFHDYQHHDVIRADAWWFGCVAPPIHPWLWQGMREAFGVRHVPFTHRKNVVILSRAQGAANGGRNVMNENAMIDAIKTLLEERGQGEKVIVFRHKDYPDMSDYLAFFNRAKVLIGPHGGAFDNLIFTPRDTLVLEFQPVMRSGRRSFFPNAMMFYQTGMLDHRYYRCFEENNGNGNMNVRIDKVIAVLRKELDGQPHMRRALTAEEAVEFSRTHEPEYPS